MDTTPQIWLDDLSQDAKNPNLMHICVGIDDCFKTTFVKFDRDKSVISRHIRDIYKENELQKEATVANNATVQKEGSREIVRQIKCYNLDVTKMNDLSAEDLLNRMERHL